MGDPSTYVSSFDRTRAVDWPPSLLLAARPHVDALRAVEVELGVFLLERSADRLDVKRALSREQRRVVHEMVEVGYNMVSSSRDIASGGRYVFLEGVGF